MEKINQILAIQSIDGAYIIRNMFKRWSDADVVEFYKELKQLKTNEQSKYDEILEFIHQLKPIPVKQKLMDNWLDNQDVCQVLRISKRTLQNYRDQGKLPFSQIGGKIYYKPSDIEKHLEENYKPV